MRNRFSAAILVLIFASVFMLGKSSPAAIRTTPQISKALAKCAQLLRLSPTQLAKVAKNNHTTVSFIRNGCWTLQHRDQVAKDPGFALRGCYKYDRMSSRQLQVVANNGHTTVAKIRNACWILEHPDSGSSSDSSTSSSSDNTPPPPTPTPECQCGAFEICVSMPGGNRCTDKNSNDNRCNSSFDCHSTFSSCVAGKCS